MKILFAWEWGAGLGHLAPFLPLAERLVSSGVDLTIAAKDLTSVRKFYTDPRIAVRQAPTLVVRQTRLWRNPLTFAGITWNLGYDSGHRIHAMVDAWRGLLLDTKPTHVVCDFGIGAALAARSLGIPWIRFGNGFSCPPATSPLSTLRVLKHNVSEKERHLEETIVRHLNEALHKIKCPKLDNLADVLGGPQQTVLSTVREFDAYDRDPDSNEYLGVWDRPTGTDPQWTSQQSPKAIAYMKGSPSATKLVLDLCRQGVAVLVVGGVPGLLTEKEVAHPLLTFQKELVNLDAAAEHCDLFLNNGNHCTTLRMIASGVPVVATPHYIEHQLTALRLDEHGLGARWRDDPKFSTQSMLDRIFGVECQANVQGFASRYGAEFQQSEQRASERLSSLLS